MLSLHFLPWPNAGPMRGIASRLSAEPDIQDCKPRRINNYYGQA
jgi:hypothetical protein